MQAGADRRPGGAWRAAAGAALAGLGIGLGASDGLAHLVRTWASSPTYNHGALVPLVSAVLIGVGWRVGDRPAGWRAALGGVALGGVAYLAASALGIRLGQHIGLALMLASAAAAVLGRALSVRHRFALGFLLFMVPFGEGLVPLLQEVTARAIMLGAGLADVPAIRDGMIIRVPAGDFRVAEACAGLRFVIASLVSGVLCAHLFFISPAKQVAMVLAAALVPVAANALRATGIVLIAEATDLRVAAGADHLVYGWAFFAVVTGAVILTAYRRAEPGAPRLPAPAPSPGPDPLLTGLAAGGIGLVCSVTGVF